MSRFDKSQPTTEVFNRFQDHLTVDVSQNMKGFDRTHYNIMQSSKFCFTYLHEDKLWQKKDMFTDPKNIFDSVGDFLSDT